MSPKFEIDIEPGELGLTFAQLSSSSTSPVIIDEILPASQLQGSGIEPGMIVHGLVLRNGNLKATRLDASTLMTLLDDTKHQEGRVLIVLKRSEDDRKSEVEDQNSVVTAIVSKKFLPKNGKSLGVTFVHRRGYPVAIKKVARTSPFRFTDLRSSMKVISVNGRSVAAASDAKHLVEDAVEQVCIKAISPAFIRLPSTMDQGEDLYADPNARHLAVSRNGQNRNEEAFNDVVVHVQVSTVLDNAAAVASGCNGVVAYLDKIHPGSESVLRQYRYVKVHPLPKKPIIKDNHCLNYLVRDSISAKAADAEFFTMEAWHHIEKAEGIHHSMGRAQAVVLIICWLICWLILVYLGLIRILPFGLVWVCCILMGHILVHVVASAFFARRVGDARDARILTLMGHKSGGENNEASYSFVLEDEREDSIV